MEAAPLVLLAFLRKAAIRVVNARSFHLSVAAFFSATNFPDPVARLPLTELTSNELPVVQNFANTFLFGDPWR